jgi:dienelactone hydrolase
MQLPRLSAATSVIVTALLAACSSSGGSAVGASTPDGAAASSSSGGAGDDAGATSSGSSSSSGGSSSGSSYDGGHDDAASSSGGPTSDAGPGAPGEAGSGDAGGGDASTGGSVGVYGAAGPDTVTTATLQVPSPNGTFTTTAYIPSADGPDPVVVLSSGFFQDGVAYAPYAQRLASWGIVTLLRDDPNLAESTPNIVSDVEYTVTTWLAATNADTTSALHGKLDTTKVGLAGHSRGGQIALLAGEGLQGKIRGVFGLDPVDSSTGSDPEARTTLATIGVPLAFIGETTDSAASGCAPAADNFLVLYGAAASPAVAITALHADHTMFEDPASCSFCTLCTAGTASQPLVLSTAVRYLTAFFARQLLGDASVGAAFAGAGANQDVAGAVIAIVAK